MLNGSHRHRESDDDIVWNGFDCRPTLGNDDELSIGEARFEVSNRANVRPYFRSIVSVADDANRGFVLADTVDISVEIWIPEIVVEDTDRDFEIDELRLLVRTVFAKFGGKSRGSTHQERTARDGGTPRTPLGERRRTFL